MNSSKLGLRDIGFSGVYRQSVQGGLVLLVDKQSNSALPELPRMNLEKRIPLRGISLGPEDISSLLCLLRELSDSTLDAELQRLKASGFEEYDKLVLEVENYRAVGGSFSSVETGVESSTQFSSENAKIASQIIGLHASTTTSYKVRNNGRSLTNFVDVTLDFRNNGLKQQFVGSPSQETSNGSHFYLSAVDPAWFALAESRLLKFFKSKSSNLLSIAHTAAIYDMFLWLIYYPLIVSLGLKFETEIAEITNTWGVVLQLGVAFWLFIISFYLAKFFYTYVRWLFPLVENRSGERTLLKSQRGVLAFVGSIAIIYLANACFDFIGKLFQI